MGRWQSSRATRGTVLCLACLCLVNAKKQAKDESQESRHNLPDGSHRLLSDARNWRRTWAGAVMQWAARHSNLQENMLRNLEEMRILDSNSFVAVLLLTSLRLLEKERMS